MIDFGLQVVLAAQDTEKFNKKVAAFEDKVAKEKAELVEAANSNLKTDMEKVRLL